MGLDPVTFEEDQRAYGNSYITDFAVASDGKSVIKTEDGLVSAFGAGAEVLNTWEEQEKCSFVGAAGSILLTASSDAPVLCLRRLKDHSQEQLLSYDRAYAHDEARLSSDGSTAMLFSYDRFRLLGMDGTVLADVEIPIPAVPAGRAGEPPGGHILQRNGAQLLRCRRQPAVGGGGGTAG